MSNDVQVGDTVYIKEGTYILSGQIDLSSKLLHLYGGFDGTETTSSDRNFETGTILDADANSRVLKIETASTIDGFTIKGGYCDGDDSDGGGIYISYSNPIITNCTITGNNTNNGYGGGIYISYSNPIITNCTITGNNANGNTSRGGGICIENGSLTITNCTIVNNTASNNQGHEICVNSGVTAYIKNTLIWNDEFNNAIYPGGTISYDHCAYPNADTTTNGNVNLSNLPSLVSSDNGLYLAKNNVALRNTSIIFGGVKDNTTPLFDQRGKRRGNPLSSSAMSIGAIEFYPVFSIDITGGTEINTTYGTSKTLTFNNTVASLDNEPMADYDNLNLTREYNVTWSVESDVSTISISDGVLTVGNTTPAGTYTVTVKAQAEAVIYNTIITSNTASKVVTVTVAKGNISLDLKKAKDLPGGTVDTAYSSVKLSEYFTATSTLNTAAIAWSISGTLPDGLTCTDGTISGTPTKAGTFNFNVVATATAENYNDVSKDITASITIAEKEQEKQEEQKEETDTPSAPTPADPTPESAEPTPVPVNPTPVSNEPSHGQKTIVDTITIPESGIDGLTSEDKANVKTLILTSVNDLSKIDPEVFKQLTTVQISKEALIENSNVDLSGLPSTVKTFIISENSSVKSLSVKNNSLTKVEAEKCVALESVDISGNTTIETINIKGSGSVTVFKANDCTNLKYIDCSECNLSDFDINNSVNLVSVDCSHNRLLTLDLPDETFTQLGNLNCISQELGNWRSTVKLNFDEFVKSPDLSVDVTISASEINGIKTSDLSKVTNLVPYDVNGNLISYSIDNDGNIIFDSKPDKFMYNYNTGYKNQIMDVTVYAADENSLGDSGSGCGGCNSAFGMLSLSALVLLIFAKPTKRKNL